LGEDISCAERAGFGGLDRIDLAVRSRRGE
jgi:hypothetical protein